MPVSTQPTSKPFLRSAIACALGVTVILACAPARAADDEAPDVKFLQGLLEGIGLQSGREKNIDYRERSPLVIPPSNALMPPETDTAAKNPNWPVDPEVKREKELRAAERNRTANASSEQFLTDQRPLPPDQMNKGPHKNSPRDTGAMSLEESNHPFTAQQLGTKRGLLGGMFDKPDDAKSARFLGEPARTSLTDPPAGYQTPSPTQAYGQSKEIFRPTAVDPYTSHGENLGK